MTVGVRTLGRPLVHLGFRIGLLRGTGFPRAHAFYWDRSSIRFLSRFVGVSGLIILGFRVFAPGL